MVWNYILYIIWLRVLKTCYYLKGVFFIRKIKYIAAASLAAAFFALPLYSSAVSISGIPEPEQKENALGKFTLSAPSFRISETTGGGEPVIMLDMGDIYKDVDLFRSGETLPDTFDLRDGNAMTSVKSQGTYADLLGTFCCCFS